MSDLATSLSANFMPHGYCLQWNTPLLIVFISGNVGIAIAYFLIPMALQRFIGKRRDLPYPHMFRLFAAFILSCGLTHLAKIWTLYHADYWFEAFLDLWTAGVSLLTAALLYPIIPKVLQLRSPKELQAANDRLEQQIEETRKARLDAEVSRDQAIQAARVKSEFISTVSHEIRTPLSGVVGLAELLSDDAGSDEARMLASKLYIAAKSLTSVVNSILDFSKLEAGKMVAIKTRFSMPKLFDAVVTVVECQASAKQLKLEQFIDPDIPEFVDGDEEKIQAVLANFLFNAVKFTESGTIAMRAEVINVDEYTVLVRFSVTDTGIGITEESLSKLFQPFVQVDSTTTRRYGGTGLGLAISKYYVELLSGTIGASSVFGEGSTFWFIVPLEK